MRLNLGCGTNKIDGYVNVDRAHDPDVVHDLEVFPWPWLTSSVTAIRAYHVLEHLGQAPAVFIGIMKQMHRVCAPGARIDIMVPHPRHDDFLDDPTHVRPITPRMLGLFSQKLNRKWRDEGWSDSQLGLEHGVDFEVVNVSMQVEPHLQGHEQIAALARERNNIVKQIQIIMECIK